MDASNLARVKKYFKEKLTAPVGHSPLGNKQQYDFSDDPIFKDLVAKLRDYQLPELHQYVCRTRYEEKDNVDGYVMAFKPSSAPDPQPDDRKSLAGFTSFSPARTKSKGASPKRKATAPVSLANALKKQV